ncbi:hypothetical protein FQN57_005120 [Myotisia sp. PD_48]|nr:hypothetical protein FQN57_005120 [Myotisia sp. PD_48]
MVSTSARPYLRSLHSTLCPLRRVSKSNPVRCSSSNSRSHSQPQCDIVGILSKPTWSVQSLILNTHEGNHPPSVTPKLLQHLLRLSALPQPSNTAEEQDMLQTLESQIHFVEQIQKIDTTQVEPLRSIYDETKDAENECAIDYTKLKAALDQEEYVGRTRRIHRRAKKPEAQEDEMRDFKPSHTADKTTGKYFVVQSSPAEDTKQ